MIGNHPKVSEVCVIGVADVGGHVPRAFVTLQHDSRDRTGVAEDIKNFANCKQSLNFNLHNNQMKKFMDYLLYYTLRLTNS